jgi:TolA-binding protein
MRHIQGGEIPVKSFRSFALLAASALALAPAAAVAQRPAPTPEQRLDRLERQIGEMQRQVFPKGRPADTAGFADDPAATQSSVASLAQRLDAVERQMADMLRQSEENSHRLQQIESDLTQLRTTQEQRITALEQRLTAAAPAPAVTTPAEPPLEPKPTTTKPPKPSAKGGPVVTTPASTSTTTSVAPPAADAGEDAYSEGFHLWEAGNYDQAITSLRAFTAAYPKHRRVSYANTLIGRSLLSKGDARGAAAALLANYRTNPSGERAQDSLVYLGQALLQMGQPGQACKAYQELDAVYGSKIRPDVKKQEADAKAQAQCS